MSSIILEKGDDKQIIELGPSFGIFLLGPFYLCVLRRWKDALIIYLIQNILLIFLLSNMISNREILLDSYWLTLLFSVVVVASAWIEFFLERFFMRQELFMLIINTPLEEYPSIFLFVVGMLGAILFHILISLFYNKIYYKRLLQQGYKPIEDDGYSQQTLEYYEKHSFF